MSWIILYYYKKKYIQRFKTKNVENLLQKNSMLNYQVIKKIGASEWLQVGNHTSFFLLKIKWTYKKNV